MVGNMCVRPFLAKLNQCGWFTPKAGNLRLAGEAARARAGDARRSFSRSDVEGETAAQPAPRCSAATAKPVAARWQG